MIRLIIFDLTDVCYTNEEDSFLKEFARKHRLPEEEFIERYMKYLERAEVNEMSGEEVWKKLLAHYNIHAEPKKLIEDMIAGKKPFADILDLVQNLRKKVKVAYFTNYNKDYWDIIERRLQVSKQFDVGIVSFQIHIRKPAPEGFEMVLAKVDVHPEEAIFIDNSEKNLAGAKRLRMHTIHFVGKDRLLSDLKKLGIAI